MDLHTAGNHGGRGRSLTDGVCQLCTCCLCFHLRLLACRAIDAPLGQIVMYLIVCVCILESLSQCYLGFSVFLLTNPIPAMTVIAVMFPRSAADEFVTVQVRLK